MFTKKRELFLKLLLFLGVGNVMQAWEITIKNNTPYRVSVTINYHGKGLFAGYRICWPVTKKLKAKKSTKFNSGACTILKINAIVFHPIKPRSYLSGEDEIAVKAKRYYAGAGRAGKTTFVIKGPLNEGKVKHIQDLEYKVIRK